MITCLSVHDLQGDCFVCGCSDAIFEVFLFSSASWPTSGLSSEETVVAVGVSDLHAFAADDGRDDLGGNPHTVIMRANHHPRPRFFSARSPRMLARCLQS